MKDGNNDQELDEEAEAEEIEWAEGQGKGSVGGRVLEGKVKQKASKNKSKAVGGVSEKVTKKKNKTKIVDF